MSLKLQEEDNGHRMDFVPENSVLEVDEIRTDKETIGMLAFLRMVNLPAVDRRPKAISSTNTTLILFGTTTCTVAATPRCFRGNLRSRCHPRSYILMDANTKLQHGQWLAIGSSLQWNQSNSHTGPHHQILDTDPTELQILDDYSGAFFSEIKMAEGTCKARLLSRIAGLP